MYVVVVPDDMSRSKVLPKFLIEPLLKNSTQKGKFAEVRTVNNTFLVKPHKIK